LEIIKEKTADSVAESKRKSGVSQAKGTSRTQVFPHEGLGFIGLEPGHPLVSLRMDRDSEIKLADSVSPIGQVVDPVLEERTTKEGDFSHSQIKD